MITTLMVLVGLANQMQVQAGLDRSPVEMVLSDAGILAERKARTRRIVDLRNERATLRSAERTSQIGSDQSVIDLVLRAPGSPVTVIPDEDDGTHISLSWAPSPDQAEGMYYLIFRSDDQVPRTADTGAIAPRMVVQVGQRIGRWVLVAILEQDNSKPYLENHGAKHTYVYKDKATETPNVRREVKEVWSPDSEPDKIKQDRAESRTTEPPSGDRFVYAVALATVKPGAEEYVVASYLSPPSSPTALKAGWYHAGRSFFLIIIVSMGLCLWFYIRRAKRQQDRIYIRRIPGVDAIEEAVGRSTEMGRPVLYVTGIEEIQNIQTIASLLVLGHVAEMTAEYDTELKVANFFPLTMVVAEEIVKQGYANSGRSDAHRPENVMFVAAEQFAFAAGVNGIMIRERPATNIYMGRFFAESLILAETGYVTGAVQIAATAEPTQLPFFVAACDYTMIGEELYAVSAYLSREPSLLAQLAAVDRIKFAIIVLLIVGVCMATFANIDLGAWILP